MYDATTTTIDKSKRNMFLHIICWILCCWDYMWMKICTCTSVHLFCVFLFFAVLFFQQTICIMQFGRCCDASRNFGMANTEFHSHIIYEHSISATKIDIQCGVLEVTSGVAAQWKVCAARNGKGTKEKQMEQDSNPFKRSQKSVSQWYNTVLDHCTKGAHWFTQHPHATCVVSLSVHTHVDVGGG